MWGGVKLFPKKLEDMMFDFCNNLLVENLLQMIKKNQLQNILILQRLIALSNLIID